MELHAYVDLSYNVESKLDTVNIQAVTTTHQRPIQTTLQDLANAGTQYEPALMDEKEVAEAVQTRDYASFLTSVESYLEHGIDTNIYADAERALKPDDEEYDARGQSTLPEIQALSHARYTRGKVISAIAYANVTKLTLVYMAVSPPGWQNGAFEDAEVDEDAAENFSSLSEYFILVWNIADNMAPLAILMAPSPVITIDVHPHRHGTVVLAGTYSGAVLVYDLDGAYASLYEPIFKQNARIDSTFQSQEGMYNGRNTCTFSQSLSSGTYPQRYYPSIWSALTAHHTLPVAQVKWLPQSSQLFRSGELQTSANPLGALQFVSVSPDGYIKAWSLQCMDKDATRSDLTVLYPFITLVTSAMYPRLGPLKPTSILFPPSDEPSTFFFIGDAFGNLACTTWPVAVAATQASDDDKRKAERDIAKDLNTTDPDAITAYFVDHPTKGSCISAFPYFLSSLFHLEYSLVFDNLLLGTAGDGCKLWLVDKQCHIQAADLAAKGVCDEQYILECNYEAAVDSGFVTVKNIPQVISPYLIGDGSKMSCFIQTNQVVTNLNLTGSNNSAMAVEYGSQELLSNKRIPNLMGPVTNSIECDFPNYNFYEPVFSYSSTDTTITAACLSQTRSSVLFVGNDRGVISVFDLCDRMYEPLISLQICVGPVAKIVYIRQASVSGASLSTYVQTVGSGGSGPNYMQGKTRTKTRDILLVGDVHGTVHILEIPKVLRTRITNERGMLKYKFRRLLESIYYCMWRKAIRAREVEERTVVETED